MDFTVQVLYRRMPSQKISSNHVIFKKYVNNEFLWKNQCWVNEHLHFLVWILSEVEWRTIQFLLLRWRYGMQLGNRLQKTPCESDWLRNLLFAQPDKCSKVFQQDPVNEINRTTTERWLGGTTTHLDPLEILVLF